MILINYNFHNNYTDIKNYVQLNLRINYVTQVRVF